MGRRSFLKLVAGSIGGVALAGAAALPRPGVPLLGSASPGVGKIVASRWTEKHDAPSFAIDGLGPRVYESSVHQAGHFFNAVGVLWSGSAEGPWIRVSGNGSDWSGWMRATQLERHLGQTSQPGQTYSDLILVRNGRYIQYRTTLAAGEGPLEISIEMIDSTDGPGIEDIYRAQSNIANAAPSPLRRGSESFAQPVISRAAWGCDESLRFDPSGQEIWVPEYRVVQKAIVHHTVTDNFEANPPSTVRAIYYYHTVTLGWGDIGYNFLVDWLGNIYEGRYGGERVVAGHVYGHNYGSLGVAVLGTYTNTSITVEANRSLARSLAWYCRYIDPHGSTYFVHDHLPNLMGHRDALSSECPGDNLYSHLPGLRGDVKWNLGYTPTVQASIGSIIFQPTIVSPGSMLQVRATVRNTGTATLITQGPEPGFVYQEGDTYVGRGYREIDGAFRVGVEFDGNRTGVDHPYRWGLPDALEPGQSAEIAGYIRLATSRRTAYWAGLVEEHVRWWQDRVAATVIGPREMPYKLFLPGLFK